MSATVEEQMVVKAIREECPWESLPKRLQSTLQTKDEWHRRYPHFSALALYGFALLQLQPATLSSFELW
jgi:hypothetical protein